METIGAHEARTHFGEILERVERGESVAVVREGRHIATIIPAQTESVGTHEAFARILTRRDLIRSEGRGLSKEDILTARDQGRK